MGTPVDLVISATLAIRFAHVLAPAPLSTRRAADRHVPTRTIARAASPFRFHGATPSLSIVATARLRDGRGMPLHYGPGSSSFSSPIHGS
jgi:hypothetical protein